MITRLFLVILTVTLIGAIVWILTIGVIITEEKPLTGWRNTIVNYLITLGGTIVCFLSGFTSELR